MSVLEALGALTDGIDDYALHDGVFACIASCMCVGLCISFVAYQSNPHIPKAHQIDPGSKPRHDHLSAHTLVITALPQSREYFLDTPNPGQFTLNL